VPRKIRSREVRREPQEVKLQNLELVARDDLADQRQVMLAHRRVLVVQPRSAPAAGRRVAQPQLGVLLVEQAEQVAAGPGDVVHVVHANGDARCNSLRAATGQRAGEVIAAVVSEALHLAHPVVAHRHVGIGHRPEELAAARRVAVPERLPHAARVVHPLSVRIHQQHVRPAVSHLVDHSVHVLGPQRFLHRHKQVGAVLVVDDAVWQLGHFVFLREMESAPATTLATIIARAARDSSAVRLETMRGLRRIICTRPSRRPR